jgi:adenosine deaminase
MYLINGHNNQCVHKQSTHIHLQGSIEEKIIQRQLSKEGLADIIDDREQVNQFSTGKDDDENDEDDGDDDDK